MKKFLVFMLVAVLAISAVFADGSKFAISGSFGTASMLERTFKDGVTLKKANSLGIGADVRLDYEVVETVFVTGVVGWQMPDRTFLVGADSLTASEKRQHYITAFAGVTKSKLEMDNTTATDIDWSIAIGPEVWINVVKGRVGGGATLFLKGAYFLADNVSIDLTAKVSAIGIKDHPADTSAHFFVPMSIKAGCTYKFK